MTEFKEPVSVLRGSPRFISHSGTCIGVAPSSYFNCPAALPREQRAGATSGGAQRRPVPRASVQEELGERTGRGVPRCSRLSRCKRSRHQSGEQQFHHLFMAKAALLASDQIRTASNDFPFYLRRRAPPPFLRAPLLLFQRPDGGK